MPAKRHDELLPGTDISLSELPKEEPRFVKRMDCVAVNRVEQIPRGANWLREVKWDGYRVCIIKRGERVSIRTKANLPPSARYKHLEKCLAESTLPDCVMDGELVALTPEGRPSFQLLQQSRRNKADIVLFAFDLLNYCSRNLRSVPLSKRRPALESISQKFPGHVHLSELLPDDVAMGRLVRALDENGLEGIVVKLRPSAYTEGATPGTWVKYRLYQIDEFVIGGYLKRDDPYFDALIVGQRDESGRMIYKEKVRFGFDDVKKRDLLKRMQKLKTDKPPFDNLPERNRRGSLNAQQMRDAVWVKPILRCTVEYTEKTQEGNIRGHGRFGQLLWQSSYAVQPHPQRCSL